MMIKQPYHLVQQSPWPLTSSLSAALFMFSITYWFHMNILMITPLAILLTLISMLCWWRDVLREASYLGNHTTKVQRGMEWGMILFIMSEIMFFVAFFWTFFHSSLSPTYDLGCLWPPTGVTPLNPFAIPLLNTATLLSSGVTITWAHHSLLFNDIKNLKMGLLLTISLGVYFTLLQLMEYSETSFSMADSVYGSSFFIATGFHGLHVMIGTLFLLTCYSRTLLNHFTIKTHFGLEAAAWYWHFVDVVWIMLYVCMYWWGGH